MQRAVYPKTKLHCHLVWRQQGQGAFNLTHSRRAPIYIYFGGNRRAFKGTCFSSSERGDMREAALTYPPFSLPPARSSHCRGGQRTRCHRTPPACYAPIGTSHTCDLHRLLPLPAISCYCLPNATCYWPRRPTTNSYEFSLLCLLPLATNLTYYIYRQLLPTLST